jgi:hypothetical protein
MSAISQQFAGRVTAGDFPSSMGNHETGQAHPQQQGPYHGLAHMAETIGSLGGDTAWVSDPNKVYGISSATIKSPLMAGIGNQ